ncbi:MAG: hypothetical protein ABI632_00255 [Pseudolysinimonas sp.]
MDVVDHAPRAWFLLHDYDELFFDVNCSQGAFGFSFLLRLTAQERAEYELRGRQALDELARAVQDSGPIARGTTSPYRFRDLTHLHGDEVMEAVMRWQSEHA